MDLSRDVVAAIGRIGTFTLKLFPSFEFSQLSFVPLKGAHRMPNLHRFDNGLTLCTEHIDGVSSVGIHVLLPTGTAHDTDETDGLAALHGELLLRGASHHSSRQLSNAMDGVGLVRGVGVGTQHLHLHGTTTGARVSQALDLMLLVMQSPTMSEADVQASASLCMQSIASLEDDPEETASVESLLRHRPPPLHRDGLGSAKVIAALSRDQVYEAWKNRVGPAGTFISIAGHIDPDAIIKQVESSTQHWQGPTPKALTLSKPKRGRVHLKRSTSQVHLTLAFDAPKATDDLAQATRLAAGVLGGGSSSRLFLEVRQRRSLCYGIGAGYSGSKHDGFVQITTGTTPERAKETLDTTCATIQTAAQDMTDDDITRTMLQVRSQLVRSGESTRARAGALARDAVLFDTVRSLQERLALLEEVQPESVRSVASQWATAEPTMVTVGPSETPLW
jgi:predicted Zn-dependent peptidase